MSGCRALSLVPSTCPRPDRLWDEGLDYQSLPVPDKTFPANQDSPAVPARSLCFRRLGTCWERRPYPRTLPHPPGRGISASATKQLSVPHPEGALATNSSKQGQLFAVPSASGSMGSAHCPQNGGEGVRLGAPGPHERRKVKVRAVAGLLDLPASVSKEHHFFVFCLFFF